MISRGLLNGMLVCSLFWVGACSDGPNKTPDLGDLGITNEAGADFGPGDGSGQDGDAAAPCVLSIDKINGQALDKVSKLTGAEDKDTATAGIQIDVEVGGSGLVDDTVVTLDVTDLVPAPTMKAAAGRALFTDVTVGSAIAGGTVLIVAQAPGCKASSLSLAVEPPPECVFVAPLDGRVLGTRDDKTADNATFDYDVRIRTTNAAGGKISLSIDTVAAGQIDPIPGSGNATFQDVVLGSGSLELKAEVELAGIKGTCTAKITVQTDKPGCKVGFTPEAVQTADGKNGLGIAQDAKPSTTGIESNITVATEANAKVTLVIDGQPGAPVSADSAGVAAFNAQPLADGEHQIQATCISDTSGNTEQSASVVTVVDGSAPVAPTDFACTVLDHRLGNVSCSWTSAGPGVARYLLRYSTSAALSRTTWPTAEVTEMSAPAFPAGNKQTAVFKGLPLGLKYYVALRATDAVANISDLANSAVVDLVLKGGVLSATLARPKDRSQWGAIIASGDFNCDGHSDVAVGDPTASYFDGSKWLNNAGRVAIYFGNPNGFLTTSTFFSGTVAGGRFGAGLAALADFDGDGSACNDLAVVASHDWTSGARIFIYLGRPNVFFREDLTTGHGAEVVLALPTAAGADETLGEAIVDAGDFDGDGATDIAITHRLSATSVQVRVVAGDKTLTPLATGIGVPLQREVAGATVATIGPGTAGPRGSAMTLAGGRSLDGDAFGDLLLGFTAEGKGMIYVVGGSASPAATTALTAIQTKISGDAQSVAFGQQLAIVGNMDDGAEIEFAVSDPQRGPNNAGAVYVFNLAASPSGLADAISTLSNDHMAANGDYFGMAVADARFGGDFNKDGFADLLVGTQQAGAAGGVVYIFLGHGGAPLGDRKTSGADHIVPAPGGAEAFGTNVIWANDINKDGFNDLLIGDPAFKVAGKAVGRVHYYH